MYILFWVGSQSPRGAVIIILIMNKYYECVTVALVIQHAKRMRRIILSSVACLAVLYFSTLSHKRNDIRKKLLNIKCVFWLSLQILSVTFVIPARIQRDYTINVHRTLYKVPLCLTDIIKSKFFKIFEKCSNVRFYKICVVVAELFLEYRQTDIHGEANSRISQF
jgi:hypothetical protein